VGEINTPSSWILPCRPLCFASTGSAPRGEMMRKGPLFRNPRCGHADYLSALVSPSSVRPSRRSRGEAAPTSPGRWQFRTMLGSGCRSRVRSLAQPRPCSVAVALAAGSILVSPFTLMLLELSVGKGQKRWPETSAARVRRALRHALTTPVVLAPALGISAVAVRIEFGYRRGSLSRSYRTDGGRRGAVPDGPDLVGPSRSAWTGRS